MSERICWYCKSPMGNEIFMVVKEGEGAVDAHEECHKNSHRSRCNLHIKIRHGRGSVGGVGR